MDQSFDFGAWGEAMKSHREELGLLKRNSKGI